MIVGTLSIQAVNQSYVNDPNGLEVWKDKDLKDKSFLKYKEEFNFIEENSDEENEYLKQKSLRKISYKETIYYFQKIKNSKYISFIENSESEFLYSSESIPLYEEPYLDSKKLGTLKKYTLVKVISNTRDLTKFKIQYQNQNYFVFNFHSIHKGEKGDLEYKIKFRWNFKTHQILISQKAPKFVQLKENKLNSIRYKKKEIYIIQDEITWKSKKYYQILYANKENLFIEKESHLLLTKEEYSNYTFQKSKFKKEKVFYSLFKKEDLEMGIDFGSLKVKQINFKKSNAKYFYIVYNTICDYECSRNFDTRSILAKKSNKETISIFFSKSEGIQVTDLDNDKIPEFFIQDYHLRGGSETIFLTFDKSGKRKMTHFIDPSEFKITKNGFYTYYDDDNSSKRKIVIWNQYKYKKGILYEKNMREPNPKWEIVNLVEKFKLFEMTQEIDDD
jgi:hypothetical protein